MEMFYTATASGQQARPSQSQQRQPLQELPPLRQIPTPPLPPSPLAVGQVAEVTADSGNIWENDDFLAAINDPDIVEIASGTQVAPSTSAAILSGVRPLTVVPTTTTPSIPLKQTQPAKTKAKPRVSLPALKVVGGQPSLASDRPTTPPTPSPSTQQCKPKFPNSTSGIQGGVVAPQRDLKDFLLPVNNNNNKRYINEDPNIEYKRKFPSGKPAFLYQGFPVMKFG